MAFRHALFVFFPRGWCCILPQNARNAQNVSWCSSLRCTNRAEMYCPQNTLRRVWHPCHHPRHPLNNSPTDGTDAHRWFGCLGFSHRIHGIHRSFWRRRAPTDFTDGHRWLGCVWFSHGIHRSFWRRIFSHGFHRCTQMVRLRRFLWEDSLVAAWVWQDAIPS